MLKFAIPYLNNIKNFRLLPSIMNVYRKIGRLKSGKQLKASSHLIRRHLIDNFLCECSFNVDQLKSSNVGVVVQVIIDINESRILRDVIHQVSKRRTSQLWWVGVVVTDTEGWRVRIVLDRFEIFFAISHTLNVKRLWTYILAKLYI